MATRITGLATGLDVDTIVKQTMQAYRTKIDTQQQRKDVLEIKQKLYRDILKDSKEFYNKHFDVLSSSSLITSKNWQAVQFSSSDESALTVTGSAGAKTGNYTVSGTAAVASKTVITEGIADKEKIKVNGEEFTIKGSTNKEIVTNLNAELKNKGINVTVRYSDFAGNSSDGNKTGFIFESSVLGASSSFVIEIGVTEESTTNDSLFTSLASNKGKDAIAATVTDFTAGDLINAIKDSKLTVKLGDKEITFEEISEDAVNGMDSTSLEEYLNKKLGDLNLSAKVEDGTKNITFTSTTLGASVNDKELSIGDKTKNLTGGEDAKEAEVNVTLDNIVNKKININGNIINLKEFDSSKEIEKEYVEYINKVLKEQGISITASLEAEGSSNVIFKTNNKGATTEINLSTLNKDVENVKYSDGGIDANIEISDGKGGVYKHTGTTNSVTLDGITFKFTGEIPEAGVTVKGTTNVDSIKEKIVKFVNDYNTLTEKLNTLISEKRDRSYNPLTKDQKAEMSEKEIELWEAKVNQGQLRRDDDLTRISNSLKQSMRTLVDGTSGLNLEKIGISPVADYSGTKNGTFTINESTLTEALENNMEDVMNMFVKAKPTTEGLTENQKYGQTGIMYRLKDILYNETITNTSSLIQKAGYEGTSTVVNNTLTKAMDDYDKKIKQMESIFSTKEQDLYNKYAKLESLMNSLNSQQSYLYQSLGLSTS